MEEYHYLLLECQWGIRTVLEFDILVADLQTLQSNFADFQSRVDSVVRSVVDQETATGSITSNGYHDKPRRQNKKTICHTCPAVSISGTERQHNERFGKQSKMEMKSWDMEVVGMSKNCFLPGWVFNSGFIIIRIGN